MRASALRDEIRRLVRKLLPAPGGTAAAPLVERLRAAGRHGGEVTVALETDADLATFAAALVAAAADREAAAGLAAGRGRFRLVRAATAGTGPHREGRGAGGLRRPERGAHRRARTGPTHGRSA